MIKRINRGEVITAKYLNEIGDSVNRLLGPVNPPSQVNKPPAGDVQNEQPEAVSPDDYVEQSRSVESVQVFDQNETNYALIDRIRTVSFVNGKDKSIKLVFNNPEV